MSNNPRKILVTSALPYANGPIHLGHMLEYIQTDIWVRFQKSRGQTCTYVCADDAHGTAIMLKAEEKGITPEQLVHQVQEEHLIDFNDFSIDFDNYYSTHSIENRDLSQHIYQSCHDRGHIASRTITQAFDPKKNLFLADRFIQGTCPRCKAPEQYGDNCEACGATYSPSDLIDPKSTLSDATPIEKKSTHYFFKLQNFEAMLRQWTRGGALTEPVANKISEWLDAGLQEWDISRDAPYFGFEIPNTKNKFFYVWLDAPIGYMASFKNLCDNRSDLDFEEYWDKDSKTELYHFIGKDIVNFHALFWPAMLSCADYRTPTGINVHGFVTVNGQKMSKSRGTFIKARAYLNHLNPEYLRYYYAAKLSNSTVDLDLNLDDFMRRVNSDLVGKVVNIASRCAGFINKRFAGQLSDKSVNQALLDTFIDAGETVAAHYENLEFSKAIREIMALADRANQYIDEQKPWVLIKDPEQASNVQEICTMGINLFRILMIYLKPVIPSTTTQAELFLKCRSLDWNSLKTPLLAHKVGAFQPLISRIEQEKIDAMLSDTANEVVHNCLTPAKNSVKKQAAPTDPVSDEIKFSDFAKVDLRVVKIIKAEQVKGADKLLKLTLDLGPDFTQNNPRTVLAGIKSAYNNPSALEGRMTVMVANLEPRKMRFGISEGMVLAAGPGEQDIWLLSPDEGALPGMRIK